MLISKFKKNKSDKIKELAAKMCIFSLLSSFKKGGKIQTGLNCEYDGLSEACLTLSHSNLKTHIDAVHEIKKPRKCSICDRSFA